MNRQTGKKRERGHAVVEVALMAPWIFFIFMAVIDIGFYCYAAINVQNAARIAALYTSGSIGTMADSATACTYVRQELNAFPFPGGSPSACTSLPLQVTASAVTSLDGEAAPVRASSVSVTVQTLPMIPIPGLMGQFTITRTAQMRVKDDLL